MNGIPNDFEEDIATGVKAEKLVMARFRKIIVPRLERVLYSGSDQDRYLQEHCVDIKQKIVEVGFDVKVRDFFYYQYNDILFETISVVERKSAGWLYKAKYVIYLWWDEDRQGFVDGYILMMDNIRDWIKGKEDTFDKKYSNSTDRGSQWETENIAVPIAVIPQHCIQRIEQSFLRPEPELTKVQINLQNWGKS